MEQGRPLSTTDGPRDFDVICQNVRTALEPARVYAVSLHDDKGDVLWLTEGSMGPDEHNAVREAFETFSAANGRPILDFDLGDSRSAVLFRAVNARRALVGAIMVIIDTRGIKQGPQGSARLMTPKLQSALSEFAVMRPTAAPPAAAKPAPPRTIAAVVPVAPAKAVAPAAPQSTIELTLADSMRIPKPTMPPPSPSPQPHPAASRTSTPAPAPPTRAPAPRATPAPLVAARVAKAAPVPIAPPPGSQDQLSHGAVAGAGIDRRATPRVSPDIDRLHAALRRSPIALHVQRLVPLIKGSQLKRYEVLLRSKSEDAPNTAPQAMLKAAVEHGLGSMIDRRVVTELIGFLVHHPDVWEKQAVLFSVNLTSTALQDEHFVKFVELCLAKSSLPKAMIAFEVDVPTAIQLDDKVAEVGAALHRLGCPMVLDDFGLRTECFDLLRLPAVRYVKLASEITAKMRTDKLSQAAITAVVQMARVLGMHTVAKRTETAAEQEWLTALGVDFIQSNALSPPVAIETLSKLTKPKV